MKKFKKVVAAVLAVCLLAISTVSAFAENTEEDILAQRVEELKNFAGRMYIYFNIGDSWGPGTELCYETDSILAFEAPLLKAKELWTNYYEDSGSVTFEEANECYADIEEVYNNLLLNDFEISLLIGFCSEENNDRNYYPEELWTKFQDKLTALKNSEDKTQKEKTDMYFDLYFTYNELCGVNTVAGDLNFDGRFTISDATTLQKAIVGMFDLNSSQLCVLKDYATLDYNIGDVTRLQRILVSIDEPFEAYSTKIINYDKDIVPKGNTVSYDKRCIEFVKQQQEQQ